jgi:hypothetical protein
MKRALALILLLAVGCPGEKPPAVETAAPPAPAAASSALGEAFSRPAEPPVVGETYVFKLLGGGERRDEVVAVGTASVTVSRTSSFGVNRGEPETVEIPLDPRAATKDASSISGAKVKDETVTISGRAFPCEVHERTWTFAKPKNSKETARDWISPRFPFILRSVANQFTTVELTEVSAKKAPEAPR